MKEKVAVIRLIVGVSKETENSDVPLANSIEKNHADTVNCMAIENK